MAGVWSKCSDIPYHGVGAACAFKNRILVFAHSTLYTFYPEKNIWVTERLRQNSSILKNYCAAVPYGDSVFLLGKFFFFIICNPKRIEDTHLSPIILVISPSPYLNRVFQAILSRV